MWIKHLSSLQFLTYVAFFGVVITAICRFVDRHKRIRHSAALLSATLDVPEVVTER